MRKAHVTIDAHDDRRVVSLTICDQLPSFGETALIDVASQMSLLRPYDATLPM